MSGMKSTVHLAAAAAATAAAAVLMLTLKMSAADAEKGEDADAVLEEKESRVGADPAKKRVCIIGAGPSGLGASLAF